MSCIATRKHIMCVHSWICICFDPLILMPCILYLASKCILSAILSDVLICKNYSFRHEKNQLLMHMPLWLFSFRRRIPIERSAWTLGNIYSIHYSAITNNLCSYVLRVMFIIVFFCIIVENFGSRCIVKIVYLEKPKLVII